MENCKKEENEQSIWVIKDQNGNFSNRSSIGKSSNKKWQYIAFKTFSQEATGYTTKEYAEKALDFLNEKKAIAGFDFSFHIECLNLEKIIDEHMAFQGDNLVRHEKELLLNHCRTVKTRMCPCSQNLVSSGVI